MIDLHLHLDGSLTPNMVMKLADLQGISLPVSGTEELKKCLSVPKDCTSLNDYLKCFDLPLSLLQRKDAIALSVKLLLKHLSSINYEYCEIRFAPQLHLKQGLSQSEVVEAALSGLKEFKEEEPNSALNASFILCMMRGDRNQKENDKTIEVAKEFLGRGVVALDLAGAEGLYPTQNYAKEFQKARELGIPFTIHAGEADGAESVRTAIMFGAKRIGHGIRARENPEVMKLLKEKKIYLELCPSSNLQTKAVNSIKEYPIREFLDYGILLTVNSDNLTVSDTDAGKEFEFLKKEFGLTEDEKRKLIENSRNARF